MDEKEIMNAKEQVRLADDNSYFIDNILSYSEHVLRITFDSDVDVKSLTSDLSIFERILIMTRNNEVCGQYDGYTTLFKELPEGSYELYLSDDESVYTEPTYGDSSDIPVVEPTLDDIKASKIDELRQYCDLNITNGVDVEINGVMEHFSYTLEDQSNIKNALEMAQTTGMSVPYHCDNGGCKLYTYSEIAEIYIKEMTNLTHNQTYFNQMKLYINTLNDIDVVKDIYYHQPLTDEYLDNYNIVMNQTQAIIQKLLEGGTTE